MNRTQAALSGLPGQPLAGLRVLDFSQVMAGPYCTMLLGDMGADIIKIEPPGTGDQTRGAMGFKMKGDDSLGFMNLNRNKRSLALDLKTQAGREVVYRLTKTADIVVENFRPGVMGKLGLDYQTLRDINPGLIYASISGFGQDGPWSHRPGFDLMAQAMSGVMSVTGHAGGPPVKAGVPVSDIGCALFSVYAILSAYIGRREHGEGQYIDTALMDTAMAFSVWDISEYWGTGRVPSPLGTANRMSAPYQAVRASDGYFVMGATNEKLWHKLCSILNREELLNDPRFTTISLRLANRDVLIQELEKTFALKTRTEWTRLLEAAGLPVGPMLSYAESFESEHAKHRQMRLDIKRKRCIYPIIPRQPDSWLNPGHGHSTATRPQFHRPFLPAAGVPVRSAATRRVRDHWPLPSAATSTTPHWHVPRRGCH